MKYGKRLVLFTLFALNLVDQPAPEVVIEQGTLSGKISADGSYFEYLGIPYGTVTRETRFKAPLPPPKWDGVYKAVDEMYSCPQTMKFLGVVGYEDCLKINVYVPVRAKKPLPVMVWIHGGAFLMGSGGKLLYAPDYLVRHDVIVVSFNYRLGALGFICLGIEEAPGNAGLKDQLAALRWVKKNIAAFGGDPDNITIFGESAGGTSSSILLASEATDGLFNKAIIQSGSSISNWSINRKPVWVASLLAKVLGHDTEDPHEIYKVLSALPYQQLMSMRPIKPLGMYFDTLLLHLPCIEKELPGVEPILTDLPVNLLRKKPKNIPVIQGTNSKEGLFLVSIENDTTLEERNQRYLFASDIEMDTETASKITSEISEFYFGDKRISMENIMQLAKLYTEVYFEIPAALESEILLTNSNASVYNYYLDYSGDRNIVKHRTGYGNESGTCHADDIFYIFNARVWPLPLSEKDRKVIDWMTKMWTNFAKYGDPTPASTSDLPVRWTPSTKENFNYLYIDEKLKMGPMPHPEAYNLWKTIYDKYRRLNLSYYLPM